jgi:hypothetical protein
VVPCRLFRPLALCAFLVPAPPKHIPFPHRLREALVGVKPDRSVFVGKSGSIFLSHVGLLFGRARSMSDEGEPIGRNENRNGRLFSLSANFQPKLEIRFPVKARFLCWPFDSLPPVCQAVAAHRSLLDLVEHDDEFVTASISRSIIATSSAIFATKVGVSLLTGTNRSGANKVSSTLLNNGPRNLTRVRDDNTDGSAGPQVNDICSR